MKPLAFILQMPNRKMFPCRRKRPAAINRLCLELLEARCLPSTVTNLEDNGPGSLRDAIATTPDGGTVDFQPGLSGTITLTSGELAINKDLTILGPGANAITVSGNHASPVFNIANFTVAISGLTIADGTVTNSIGNSPNSGGGIYNLGTLTVTDSAFSDNSASGFGGGIENVGTLTVTDSTFSANSAYGGGGISNDGLATIISSIINDNIAAYAGVFNDAESTMIIIGSTITRNEGSFTGGGLYNYGVLLITSSTISYNRAGGSDEFYWNVGGGIVSSSVIGGSASLMIMNSTISGNTAAYAAGGIFSFDNYAGSAIVAVVNCTVSGNTAFHSSGGMSVGARTTMRNTILAGNNAYSFADVSGSLTSLGHNLIGIGDGGSGYAGTDLVGTAANPIDPLLGPLQNNGGPTETMALLPGSPAIGASGPSDSEWDQRGPGYPRSVNGTTDIGAYEVQPSGTGCGRLLQFSCPRADEPAFSAGLGPQRRFRPERAVTPSGRRRGSHLCFLDQRSSAFDRGTVQTHGRE